MELDCCGVKLSAGKDCIIICDDDCSYEIWCGDVVIKGKPKAVQPPPNGGHEPLGEKVKVGGNLHRIAKSLSSHWGRPVVVPARLRGKSIRERTLTGSPEEIVKALGLQFR
jgi:hypothetical protein